MNEQQIESIRKNFNEMDMFLSMLSAGNDETNKVTANIIKEKALSIVNTIESNVNQKKT